MERIADHWMRKNLKSAKEAMDLARQERDKYANWKAENESKGQTTGNTAQAKQSSSNYRQRKTNGRTEQVPDWFYKREEESAATVMTNEQKAIDFEQERQKILKKLGQNGR